MQIYSTPFTQLTSDYIRRVGCSWHKCVDKKTYLAVCVFGMKKKEAKTFGLPTGEDDIVEIQGEKPSNYVFA